MPDYTYLPPAACHHCTMVCTEQGAHATCRRQWWLSQEGKEGRRKEKTVHLPRLKGGCCGAVWPLPRAGGRRRSDRLGNLPVPQTGDLTFATGGGACRLEEGGRGEPLPLLPHCLPPPDPTGEETDMRSTTYHQVPKLLLFYSVGHCSVTTTPLPTSLPLPPPDHHLYLPMECPRGEPGSEGTGEEETMP